MNKEIIKIPKYSDSILFNMKPEDIIEMDRIIFTKEKKNICNILLSVKEHFPNAHKTQHIIDKILNDLTILNKCNLVYLTGTSIFMNAIITICPLRDHDQTNASIKMGSKYRDEYKQWLNDNKGKDFFDFVKENDVEEIYIHINPNSNWRIETLIKHPLSFFPETRRFFDPEYDDILFLQSLFKN